MSLVRLFAAVLGILVMLNYSTAMEWANGFAGMEYLLAIAAVYVVMIIGGLAIIYAVIFVLMMLLAIVFSILG